MAPRKREDLDSADNLKVAIVQSDCAIKAAISDIWQHNGSLDDLQREYEVAREKLKLLRNSIDKYEIFGREANDVKQLADIESSAKQFREQLQNTTLLLRSAFVEKKSLLDERNRASLFNTNEDKDLRRRRKAEDNRENIARTANDVTQNLLSISRVISDSINLSGDSLNTLVKSSGTIRKTDEELKDQSGVIKTGHRLLTKYSRRECTDKFLIFLALALFFSTVLYILKKRLWFHYSYQGETSG